MTRPSSTKQAVSTLVLGAAVAGAPLALLVVLPGLTEGAVQDAAVRMARILWGIAAFGGLIVLAGIVRLARAVRARG